MRQREVQRIIDLWQQQRGQYFFVSRKRGESWIDHAFAREEFGNVARCVRGYADWNLYWCVHGFRKPRRLERYAEPTPFARAASS
jgi:hypothetical protein